MHLACEKARAPGPSAATLAVIKHTILLNWEPLRRGVGHPSIETKISHDSHLYNVGGLQGLGSLQQETKTDGEVCLGSMHGQHACLDDLGSSSAIHRSPSPEF